MKIGIEVQRIFRKKKYGIETSSLELIKKIQELEPKHQFVLFAKDDQDRGCFRESGNFKIKTLAGDYFADFEQIFLPLAAMREKIDLLHCTGNTTPYFSPVPVIQTLHDIIFMDPIPPRDSLYQRWGNLYRRKLVPLITLKSKVVITVSHYEKQRIISRLGIDESKIQVIYNGLNEKRFRIYNDMALLERVRKQYNLPTEFILYLGNPSGRKNPIGVVEAYLMYCSKVQRPLPLVAPGLTQKYISAAMRPLKVPAEVGQFITPGYVKEEDLPYVYNLSSVFLFPSLSEGFGMPILEAMACGTPVITSKISSMPEIAGEAALLVDPTSPPSIAEALVQLHESQELQIEKIEDGLINVKRFSWTKTAEQVLQVYDGILSPTATKAAPRKKIHFEPSLYFFNKPRPTE
jgi:glycosyltransferase involved in cell wall biosynthesis